jgi:hypothetical protein
MGTGKPVPIELSFAELCYNTAMATVKIGTPHYQDAHYGLYRTLLGGDERVIIRRKIGEPVDVEHNKSRKLAQQRERLTVASRHWTNLTPSQKNFWRSQIRFVSRTGSPSEDVLLAGRQLFVSEEIASLLSTGTQVATGYELCIILCDELYKPLWGYLTVSYFENGVWTACLGQELERGNWLFSNVPKGKEVYRIEGWAFGYIDPKRPEDQQATEQYLIGKHYHVLVQGLKLVIAEPWTPYSAPPQLAMVIKELWGEPQPPSLARLILEPWAIPAPPSMEREVLEPWTALSAPPSMEREVLEPWTALSAPPSMEREVLEPWTANILPDLYITLKDQNGSWLAGTIHVYYYLAGQFTEWTGSYLGQGKWLFNQVPSGMQWYRIEGEKADYYDPKLPADQWATEAYLRAKTTQTIIGPLGAQVTVKIYSDTTHGSTTVDGYAQRTGVAEPWATIHNSVGLGASPDINYLYAGEAVNMWTGVWKGLARNIMTFKLLSVPTYAQILSARFALCGYQKTDTYGSKPQIALYQSYPLADNNVVAADYQRLYNAVLSNIIGYDSYLTNGFNYFNLNAAGLALLIPQQLVRLGLREAKYDAPNIEGPSQANNVMLFYGRSVDYSVVAQRPYLEVTFRPVV